MNERIVLATMSVLAAVLGSFHLTDDIVRGFEAGGPETYTGMMIVVVWLYAALVLSGRRAGYVIVLLGSILGAAIPYLHMRFGLAGGRVANTSGMFFWVFTLFALGVTSILSAILAARGLWSSFRAQPSR